jgi:hypothetical protein
MHERLPHALAGSASQFARQGYLRARAALAAPLRAFLHTQITRLCESVPRLRPWHCAELHNPWSRAASCVDSWGFLDLCRSPSLLEGVTTLLGADVILFDSELLPDTRIRSGNLPQPHSEAHRFAVTPLAGLTVLVALGDGAPATSLHLAPASAAAAGPMGAAAVLPLAPGEIVFIDPRLPYRLEVRGGHGAPRAYAARYFPATCRYLRDPAAPEHRKLTERYPFVNYARLPLWLVHGRDRAGNDFVTGFDTRAGYWSSVPWQ